MELPEGFKLVRLEDIANFKMGKTPKRSEEKYWKNGVYNWVSIKDMKNKYLNTTKEKVSEEAFKEVFKGKIVPKGTLLMSFKLTIGRTAILDIDAVHNEAIISINPKENILRDYLYWALPSLDYKKYINPAIKGNTLNKEILKNLLIPIPYKDNKPDLQKQREIVNKIETLFNNIDKAIELRQKALNETKNLFNSVLNRVFKEVSEDEGKLIKLKEIVKTEKGKKPKKLINECSDKALPYLTVDYYRSGILKQYSEENEKMRIVKPNDLVLIWDGSKSGKIFISDIEGILSSTMVKINIKDVCFNNKYMHLKGNWIFKPNFYICRVLWQSIILNIGELDGKGYCKNSL